MFQLPPHLAATTSPVLSQPASPAAPPLVCSHHHRLVDQLRYHLCPPYIKRCSFISVCLPVCRLACQFVVCGPSVRLSACLLASLPISASAAQLLPLLHLTALLTTCGIKCRLRFQRGHIAGNQLCGASSVRIVVSFEASK